jgi:hypothetical protein
MIAAHRHSHLEPRPYDRPVADDLPNIGAPATRALAGIGVTRLDQLADYRERDLLALHGFGPRALRILTEALQASGQSLRPDD